MCVYVYWCQTRLNHMRNISGCFIRGRNVYPSRPQGFTPGLCGVCVAHLLRCLCCVFVFLCPVLCVPNIDHFDSQWCSCSSIYNFMSKVWCAIFLCVFSWSWCCDSLIIMYNIESANIQSKLSQL